MKSGVQIILVVKDNECQDIRNVKQSNHGTIPSNYFKNA